MDKIKIRSWNVNGIRAIHKKGFLKWFINEKPDILCLQETKATRKQFPIDLRVVDSYHLYSSEAEKRGYSGTATYSSIEPEKVEYGFGIDRFDLEGRTIITDYGDFILFNIYFPNGKMSPERLQYKMEFYDVFLEYV